MLLFWEFFFFHVTNCFLHIFMLSYLSIDKLPSLRAALLCKCQITATSLHILCAKYKDFDLDILARYVVAILVICSLLYELLSSQGVLCGTLLVFDLVLDVSHVSVVNSPLKLQYIGHTKGILTFVICSSSCSKIACASKFLNFQNKSLWTNLLCLLAFFVNIRK